MPCCALLFFVAHWPGAPEHDVDLMSTVANLARWEVPFAGAADPSVSVITEQGGDVVTLIVAPAGIDQYPKYRVRFAKVIALNCHEEACSPDPGYRVPSGSGCAFLWVDSPALESYRRGKDVFEWHDLQHFVVLGGDSIVELIAAGQPEVERLEQGRTIEVRHEV